ncbi:MAG: TRAP transporter small permease [Bacillota bacterium]|nr:TRAP transporter small permease [Bacillota bacterium]
MSDKNRKEKHHNTPVHRVLKWIIELPDKISFQMFLASGLVCVSLGFIVFTSSMTRYFMNKPIRGIYEISGYCLFIMTFLAIPFLLKTDKHVSIEAIKEMFSPRVQKYLDIFNMAVCFPLGLLIFVYSSVMTYDLYKSGLILFDTIEPPRYIFMFFVMLCFLIFALIALKKLITAIKEIRNLDGDSSTAGRNQTT